MPCARSSASWRDATSSARQRVRRRRRRPWPASRARPAGAGEVGKRVRPLARSRAGRRRCRCRAPAGRAAACSADAALKSWQTRGPRASSARAARPPPPGRRVPAARDRLRPRRPRPSRPHRPRPMPGRPPPDPATAGRPPAARPTGRVQSRARSSSRATRDGLRLARASAAATVSPRRGRQCGVEPSEQRRELEAGEELARSRSRSAGCGQRSAAWMSMGASRTEAAKRLERSAVSRCSRSSSRRFAP